MNLGARQNALGGEAVSLHRLRQAILPVAKLQVPP